MTKEEEHYIPKRLRRAVSAIPKKINVMRIKAVKDDTKLVEKPGKSVRFEELETVTTILYHNRKGLK